MRTPLQGSRIRTDWYVMSPQEAQVRRQSSHPRSQMRCPGNPAVVGYAPVDR